MSALRRGACPRIATPMPTGDGLLARLPPQGTLSIANLIALCDAALECGNGVLEVTQRGSLQVRGLSYTSAPLFARRVFSLGLAAEDGPQVLASPLMGFDAHEQMDLGAVLLEVRAGLTDHAALKSLNPKVSTLLDGGGALNLDGLSGDLRLRAVSDSRLLVNIAGDASTATTLGTIEPGHAADVAVRILTAIAALGSHARARDLTVGNDVAILRRSLAHLMSFAPVQHQATPAAQPIGMHHSYDGRLALGIALAFGHTDATTLRQLALLAAERDATSIETAPGRALLVVGLHARGAQELSAAAAKLGFIVWPDDPRRFVVACAGAPACGSAKLATRVAAPEFARAASAMLDGSITIHLSGCSKGCAHPGPAAITFVGPDGLVLQGRACDQSHIAVSVDRAISGLAHLNADRHRSSDLSADSAAVLSRLGIRGVLAAMRLTP